MSMKEQLQNAVGSGVGSLINTGLGLLLQKHNDKRQLEQQGKLGQQQLWLDLQKMSAQKAMELQMWKDTNYSAQVEELEKAGLNPALLYGKGGGGGATTGGGASGVGSANAPVGGNEILGLMMQKQQMELMKAQVENVKADAHLKNVEAAKKGGVDTENVKADTQLKILEQVIKDYTGRDTKDVYERIKVPNRGIEEKTYQDELESRQAVASNIVDLWTEGKLYEKSNAEIESILVNNAKNREERKKPTSVIFMILK